eukprot:TRINITY_DN16935_c0_g1_i1.p1 TRINITY_DN16935_c0_g1~~TRINITY_DN16935_c0_g1_i1.p1  ORF type:complete len:190 (-),score=26.55 TRINITY_DN16935_c0_g1_i1:233-745(-)
MSCSAVISACSKAREWEVAIQMLSLVPKAGLPAVHSFSSAIAACGEGGQWEMALDLFYLAQQADVTSDRLSYSATISACGKAGRWEATLQLLSTMRNDEKAVADRAQSYRAAISACRKAGRWEIALDLFKHMPDAAYYADQAMTPVDACGWLNSIEPCLLNTLRPSKLIP